jgi:hypothetical protein
VREHAAAAAAAFLAVVAGLSGCAGSGSGPDPAGVLKARMAALVSSRSVGLDGTVTMGGATYVVSVSEDDRSAATGAITIGKTAVTFTSTGGRLFLRGRDYFAAQKIHAGDRWVLDQEAALGGLLRALTDRTQLTAALTALAGQHVSEHAGPAINGMPTIQLVSDRVTVTAPASGVHRGDWRPRPTSNSIGRQPRLLGVGTRPDADHPLLMGQPLYTKSG